MAWTMKLRLLESGSCAQRCPCAQGTSFAAPELRSGDSLGACGVAADLVEWSG